MLRLRRAVGDVRPSDLDGIDPANVMGNGIVKEALHGTADNWFEATSPYQTSPLVNPTWEMGGRWRNSLPGGGDQHINDDGDKQKSLKDDAIGQGSAQDHINMALEDAANPETYIVKVVVQEGQDPEKIRDKLGEGAKYDGRSVSIPAKNFGEATRLQRQWPGAIVETVKKEMGI